MSFPPLPLEFTHSYIFSNRYNMPKHQNYELLVTNGFIKLFTLPGRVYWIAQMEQYYRTPDWKFHISVKREEIPKAWDIVARIFMGIGCKSCMKCLFLKDPSSVAKGREITVYIYRYDRSYGEGLDYTVKDQKVLFKLDYSMEQNGSFWMNFLHTVENELKKSGITVQGCADGDLPMGEYFSLRNESFALHKKEQNGKEVWEYEYPYDSDGWNNAGHKLPFELGTSKKKHILTIFSVLLLFFVYFLVK